MGSVNYSANACKIFSGRGNGSVVTDMARLLIFSSPSGIHVQGEADISGHQYGL